MKIKKICTPDRLLVADGMLVRPAAGCSARGELYMVCQVGPNQYKVIGLADGNRYSDREYMRGEALGLDWEVVTYAEVVFGTR